MLPVRNAVETVNGENGPRKKRCFKNRIPLQGNAPKRCKTMFFFWYCHLTLTTTPTLYSKPPDPCMPASFAPKLGWNYKKKRKKNKLLDDTIDGAAHESN